MRDHDFPAEVLQDEDLSVTLPRRFGLSGVVDKEIKRYRKVGRRRRRIPAREFEGLVGLVARRPDAKDVFFDVGRSLAPMQRRPLWSWTTPERRIAAVRDRVARRLRGVFGGNFISVRRGSPALEAIDRLLAEADPGGGACSLVTGCMQEAIDQAGLLAQASHVACVVRGEEACRWEFKSTEVAEIRDVPGEVGEAVARDTADREGGVSGDHSGPGPGVPRSAAPFGAPGSLRAARRLKDAGPWRASASRPILARHASPLPLPSTTQADHRSTLYFRPRTVQGTRTTSGGHDPIRITYMH